MAVRIVFCWVAVVKRGVTVRVFLEMCIQIWIYFIMRQTIRLGFHYLLCRFHTFFDIYVCANFVQQYISANR